MNKINICFMSDDAVEKIRANPKEVTEYINKNKLNSRWLFDYCGENIYEEKKYKIPEFKLKVTQDGDYSKVDYDNSIILYENLKHLPRHILTDERFWAWFNFTIGYQASIQSIPLNKKGATITNHWLFTRGKRRGNFFGVMSRCYFRVALSIDETLEDKYELTKFVIEEKNRFRNLSWRTYSNNPKIVLGILKAEKDIFDQFGSKVMTKNYEELAKYISLYCSINLIDAMNEDDIRRVAYNKLKELVAENQE